MVRREGFKPPTLIRSQSLYPAEVTARFATKISILVWPMFVNTFL